MQGYQAHGLDHTLLHGFCTVAHALAGGTYGQDACGFVCVWLRCASDIVALGTCCTCTAAWLTPQCPGCHRIWQFVGGKSHVPWESLLHRCIWATFCCECFDRDRPCTTLDLPAPPLIDPLRGRRRVEHEATYPFPTGTPGVFYDIPVWSPTALGQRRRPAVIVRRVIPATWTYSCHICRREIEGSLEEHFGNNECLVLNEIHRMARVANRALHVQIAEVRRTGAYPWNRDGRMSPARARRRLG